MSPAPSTAAGWLGAGLLLAGYLLVSTRRLPGDGVGFQALNVIGSAGLGIAAAVGGVWSSVALNAVWVGIGAWVLGHRGWRATAARRCPPSRSPDRSERRYPPARSVRGS